MPRIASENISVRSPQGESSAGLDWRDAIGPSNLTPLCKSTSYGGILGAGDAQEFEDEIASICNQYRATKLTL
jgi:hypothetical protein